MPAVSVLMPVRNAAEWLHESLGSIVDQIERDWELLAIDDGSTDASPGILAEHARVDARIRVFSTSSDARGLVHALNLGLYHASAPLVARMDADDVAHSERLAAQCEAMNAAPELFGCSCRVAAFPERLLAGGMRRYLAWQNALTTPDEIARDRFIESPVVHPSLVLRTAVLRDRLGGWHENGWPEDWDLVLRAVAEGLRFARVPAELMRWRLHAAQATRTDPRYGEDRLRAVRAYFLADFLRQRGSGQVWILGAGPVGKQLAKGLARNGLIVAGFVDVDPRKIGGIVHDRKQRWPVVAMESLFEATPRPFAIAAVGRPGGRRRIRELLTKRGWSETQDFVVAA